MKNPLLAFVSAVLLAGMLPADAAPEISLVEWDQPRSVVIAHEDLNLATAEGIERLHWRIKGAIARVCDMPNAEDLGQRHRAVECRRIAQRQALDQAERLIGAARLSAAAR